MSAGHHPQLDTGFHTSPAEDVPRGCCIADGRDAVPSAEVRPGHSAGIQFELAKLLWRWVADMTKPVCLNYVTDLHFFLQQELISQVRSADLGLI